MIRSEDLWKWQRTVPLHKTLEKRFFFKQVEAMVPDLGEFRAVIYHLRGEMR